MTIFSTLRAIWMRLWPGLILALLLYTGYRAYWIYQEHLGMQQIILFNLQQGKLIMPQLAAPSPVVELPSPTPTPAEKPPGDPQ